MEQMVDLLDFPEFRGLDVALVSVAFDSAAELADGAVRYGITEAALLTDVNHEVAQAYDVCSGRSPPASLGTRLSWWTGAAAWHGFATTERHRTVG